MAGFLVVALLAACALLVEGAELQEALLTDSECEARSPNNAACALDALQRRGLRSPLSGEAPKPHILLFLADDFGWGNIGFHRDGTGPDGKQAQAEVNTPTLDKLAKEGIILDRHYAFRICSPSRSSLISGRLPVHVNMINSGVTDYNPSDPVSGAGGIPRNMTGLAQKLKEAGYSTHLVGKWDVGMATPEHTPTGRGFDTFFGYFQHANDYWQKSSGFIFMGEIDVCLNKFVDFSFYNGTYRGGVTAEISAEYGCPVDTGFTEQSALSVKPSLSATGCPTSSSSSSSKCLPDGCYEEAQLKRRALSIIEQHDASVPLFLYYSTHLVHTPLQVPAGYLERLDKLVLSKGGKPIDTSNRRLYAAMTLYMDDVMGELEQAMKAKGLWDNTLVVFFSDNGGPIYEPGSANNHPLKGGKYSHWDGGFRTNAFLSGGFVPSERRGSTFEGVVSVADWYATFAELAGVDPEDKASAEANTYLAQHSLPQLHPIDGRAQWSHITAGTNGRPDALHLSPQALLEWPYKLVTAESHYSVWQGELFPNCTSVANFKEHGPVAPVFEDAKLFGRHMHLPVPPEKLVAITETEDCGAGCLFNVQKDPAEHTDLASDPAMSEVLARLQAKLKELNTQLFEPDRGESTVKACYVGLDQGGFYGPYAHAETFYTQKRAPTTDAEKKHYEKSMAEFQVVDEKLQKSDTAAMDFFTTRVGPLEQILSNDKLNTCLDKH